MCVLALTGYTPCVRPTTLSTKQRNGGTRENDLPGEVRRQQHGTLFTRATASNQSQIRDREVRDTMEGILAGVAGRGDTAVRSCRTSSGV